MRLHERKGQRDPKKIVFPEGDSLRILRAVHEIVDEGIGEPIVLGNLDEIKEVAAKHEICLDGIQVIDRTRRSGGGPMPSVSTRSGNVRA